MTAPPDDRGQLEFLQHVHANPRNAPGGSSVRTLER